MKRQFESETKLILAWRSILFVCLKGVFSTVFFSVSFIVNHETELSSELQKNVSINGLIWKSVLNQ